MWGLIVTIVVLVLINIFIGIRLVNNRKTTPALEAMKDISKVYEILTNLVDNTSAYKAAISKVCYKCDFPYAEMLYDNKVINEERYNYKFNRLPLDEDVVNELKMVAKGRMVPANIKDLPAGMKKDLYSAEGIIYSETHKIIMVDQFLYVLVLHYKIPIEDVDEHEFNIIKKHKSKLIQVFEDNRSKL